MMRSSICVGGGADWSIRLLFILYFVGFCQSASSFLAWQKATGQQIERARIIGIQARYVYSQAIKSDGLTERDRKLLYLDGLQKCNSIDDELIASIDKNIVKRSYRKSDSDALEKTGLNPFFASFVTLPAVDMKKVVNLACAKHEQQLECGLQYEGEQKTNQRIAELMEDGGNRQMFEHECVDEDYATGVYPCLGRTDKWIGACEKEISEYSILREKVNNKINSVYNSAIQTVKSMNENREQVFTDTMKLINYAEGSKCLSFKKMRVCLLQQLVNVCGIETARALNTSLSVAIIQLLSFPPFFFILSKYFEDTKIFDNFVFNFFAVLTLSILMALCGKNRTTARNVKKPSSKSPSKKEKSSKPRITNSARSTKKSSDVPKVVGCQPTREDEGLDSIDTHTKTLSDEKIKTDRNSQQNAINRSSKQKEIQIEQKSSNSTKTVSEKKKKTLSDEPSRKRDSSFSDSMDESENDSLETIKKTGKSSKDEEKSSSRGSIRTEEDNLTKTKSIDE
ncbi:hypothetical protein L5515_001466 [Caenorhabditis briggsae]|uniref:Uncharacterized protein n=1 Tax=Caenorhabditis briggsae TaxID=6238 RepID=A0AAE9J3G2_CAEBR|nr:hypothetical protein L5515_001466 [Caenorhabditis briggsae]